MWSYSKFHRKSCLILAAFYLTGGILGYIVSRSDQFHHHVLITLESSLPAETQLFYNTGRGFNENDSIRKVIYQANTPVTLDFDLTGPKLDGLRFDPSRSPAKINIHKIILKYQGEKPFTVPLDSLTAIRDIKLLHYDGQTLTVETTEAAQDPILHLSRIGPAPHPSTSRTILFILGGAFIALGVAFFIRWVYQNCLIPTELKA
jgi:hypothetical protein